MSLSIFWIVLSLSIILRFYTMFFMTKKEQKGTIYYRWSYPLLLITYNTTYFGAALEYFLPSQKFLPSINILGVVILFFGIALTGWTIKAVGKDWSQHIEIKKNHQLCTTGPYQHLKHPYYVGVFLELFGGCLAYNGVYALIFLGIIHVPLVIIRSRLEEQVMRNHSLILRAHTF